VVGLDAAANAYGGVMSNLQLFHMVAPHASVPVSQVHAAGGLPTTGTVAMGQGYPILFQ